MTREEAIHKTEFLIKAYQNRQPDKAPIQEYQEMIDALTMAKEALQEKPHCIASVTLNEEKMRELCHEAVQELYKRIEKAFKDRGKARKVLYFGDVLDDMAQCPNCSKTFREDYSGWLDPYCSHCGQKLDWGFEEIEKEGSDE